MTVDAAPHPHGSVVEQVHRVWTTDQGVSPWVLAEETVRFLSDRLGQDRDWARSIAVRVEGELADLRQAIDAIHTPKAVALESDLETPEIICATCRTDFPCETKAFADALDPINGLDEFVDQPEPF